MDRFIHITGSIPNRDGVVITALAKQAAYETALALLQKGTGLVALVGASANSNTTSLDDEIIRAAAEYVQSAVEPGIVIQTVRHNTKWAQRISDETRDHLDQLANNSESRVVADGEYTGGTIRKTQAELSHGAIVIGGYKGVKDTAELLMRCNPPKPIEEIIISGQTGGLPDDIRAQIDASRGRKSEPDRQTIKSSKDCTRAAVWTASSIVKRLQTNVAKSDPKDSHPKAWGLLKSKQAPAWVGLILRAIGLILRAIVPTQTGG